MQLLRCSWNCGSARIAAASQGATQSLRVQKTPTCWNMRAGIAVGSLYGNGQFPKVPHLLLRRFDVLKKIRLSSRRLPFAPILLGKCTSVRTRRLRNRAGSAMFLEPQSGADSGGGVKGRRRVCGFKNFRLLEQVRRNSSGQSVSERAVSESSASTSAAFRCFEKNPTFLSSAPFRADIAGKMRISPHAKSALCAAPPARVKFPDGNAQQRMRATCRVCRSGTQLFSAAHACDFKVANGLVVLYKYVPRRQRV